MHTVYLAGPITGLTFDNCTDWRNYAIEKLALNGVKGLSPMRCKDFLKQYGALDATCEGYGAYGPLATAKGIISRDRFDATRCDVMLVNLLGAKIVSIGTVMEIAWADLSRIPVVCAIEEKGNPHEHGMIQEALNFRVTTLDDAINVVNAILV